MKKTDEEMDSLIDKYLGEIMSREKPDVKLYQGTIEFILQLSVQKMIAELDEIKRLLLITAENKTYSVLQAYVYKVASSYRESGSAGPGDVQMLRNLSQQIDSFEISSYQFIEILLFQTYLVSMDRLERLPNIDYGNFFYYNQMAPKDVDIAEDIYFLNEKLNGFVYARFLLDMEGLGLKGDLQKKEVESEVKNQSEILRCLSSLIDTYTNWLHMSPSKISVVDSVTAKNGMSADEEFLFSKISRSVAGTKRRPAIPTTFLLTITEDGIRSAYKELEKSNRKFGLDNTEDAFVYLFQGKPITSNFKPIIWRHSLRSLIYFFSKMVKEGILLNTTWPSHIVNHSLIIHNGEIPTIGRLKSTKVQISDWLEMSDEEMYKRKEFNDYRFFLSIVDLLKAKKI